MSEINDINEDYLWGRRYKIRHHALTNRLYHQERHRIFEKREGFVKAFPIIFGSVAFASISNAELFKWCIAIITVFSTFSLVFNFGGKSNESIRLSTEWAKLEKDIEQVGERDFTEDNINNWFAKAYEIELNEPTPHPVLFELCNERAVQILGGEIDEKLTNFQRLMPIIMIP